ncbi:MAG: hypothetical protein JWM85_1278 [Acidimicrobiaceae bacterium]|nr:hypothetical protein [Acidimicrobiaceae bacterium]
MSRQRRVVVLVLDGLGIGASADAPEPERGANTLVHVEQVAGPLQLPTLTDLGLARVANLQATDALEPRAAYGSTELGYPGADTFLGHQTLMGASPHFALHLLEEAREQVMATLTRAGHSVRPLTERSVPLLVDEAVLVADNVEARRGLSINVTGSLDATAFDELLAIGQLVRSAVEVPRVIVVAGRGFDPDSMRHHLRETSPGQIGVDTPGMGVYDEHYQVRQLGANANGERSLPTLVLEAGGSVILLGKAADVISCEDARRDPVVPTAEVLKRAREELLGMTHGLLVANVQETDLAGHEQDPVRLAHVLGEVDELLPSLIEELGPDDLLLVTADHGNDPTNGSSQHTREAVPVLVSGKRVRPGPFGTRASLADVGATAARFLGLGPLAQGEPLGEDVVRCS